MDRITITAVAAALATLPMPAVAEVASATDSGFVVTGQANLPGSDTARVWAALVRPQDWWSSAHSWSGSAANMTLHPVAGGCFCETLPGDHAGTVEHMRVIHARPGATLVMRGSLGPLQGEAVTGVLTISLAAVPGEGERGDAAGTVLSWTYVVGGFSRYPLADMAPAVDGVVTEQMGRLAAHLAAS